MWFMSNQGMEVLRTIYDLFRSQWHKDNPHHNENDCERAFLTEVANRTHHSRTKQQSSDIQEAIDKIR